jgi:hypothetical protein
MKWIELAQGGVQCQTLCGNGARGFGFYDKENFSVPK